MKNLIAFCLITIIFFGSCTAPKSVINSGKATPKGDFKVGADYSFNIPTQTVSAVYDNISYYVKALSNKDSIVFDQQVKDLNKAIIAYSLDPIGSGTDFYLRYGIVNRLDAGYKNSSGTHVFDLMYQFAGPTGKYEDKTDKRFYGSIGLQYSLQELKMPDWMKEAAQLLLIKFERKDLLVPVIFSHAFGNEEEVGAFSYGLVYSRTFVKYGFDANNIYSYTGTSFITLPSFQEKLSFGSLGGFMNLKVGYRAAYLILGLSIYGQTYGSYRMINGENVKLKGSTFIPTAGLQLNPSEIYRSIKGKNKAK